jgi:hypothetical protein
MRETLRRAIVSAQLIAGVTVLLACAPAQAQGTGFVPDRLHIAAKPDPNAPAYGVVISARAPSVVAAALTRPRYPSTCTPGRCRLWNGRT